MKPIAPSSQTLLRRYLALSAIALTSLTQSGCMALPVEALYAAQYIPGALAVMSATTADKTTESTHGDKSVVREIQARLTAKGYDPGSVDGVYGLRTRRAIIQYQRDMGLEEHGRADTELLARLR